MTILDDALRDQTVLVTGATGFIGGALALRLAQEEGARVTGIGRNLDAVPFLPAAGVQLQRVDLQDVDALRAAMAGQNIIFHVAAWLSSRHGEADQAYALNVAATRELVRLAADAGVQRFVMVSSIAAYGPPDAPIMDESHPVDPSPANDLYGRTKAEGESEALRLGRESGLPVTIVRPAQVYGPRSMNWTVGMLRLVQRGVPTIVGDGSGHALPVYIDNLLDGMLLAAVRPAAIGQAFQFCDPPVLWRDFFAYYGAMCGRRPRAIPGWAAGALVWVNEVFHLGLPLNRERMRFLQARSTYPTDKAARLLGYQPRVAIQTGMARAEAWLREAGYLERR